MFKFQKNARLTMPIFVLLAISTIIFLSMCESKSEINGKTADKGTTRESKTAMKTIDSIFKSSGYDGAFIMSDLKKDTTFYHNKKRCSQRFLPASTFKIPNSIIGLETGVIEDENYVIKWDGVKRYYDVWNKDHDLKTALKNSTVWYYQELARRVGEKRMKQYIDSFKYGNMDMSGGLDKFWLSGNIRISAVEQIAFLKKLYKNELPVSRRSMDIVKKIMLVNETDEYKIRAKTGGSDIYHIGWFVGWIEKGDDVFFFATNIDSNGKFDKNFMAARKQITYDALQALGVI